MNRIVFWWWRVVGEPINVRIYWRALAGDNGVGMLHISSWQLNQTWDAQFRHMAWWQMTHTERQYMRWCGVPAPAEP